MMEDGTDPETLKLAYSRAMASLHDDFFSGRKTASDLLRDRSAAADALVQGHWQAAAASHGALQSGVAVMAVGGYGRSELFPSSDIDLVFLIDTSATEKLAKDGLRSLSQLLWDSGTRLAACTRTVAECGRFSTDNAEFTLSLLDRRFVAGDASLADRLMHDALPNLLHRERKNIAARLLELTAQRHALYGDTLFHLEPNVKECPGGLRDANVCGWLGQLAADVQPPGPDFHAGVAFLTAVRCFLHLQTGRDINALDWKTQDDAAAAGVGVANRLSRDSAHWMQLYFRHARVVARRLEQQTESLPKAKPLLRLPEGLRRRGADQVPGMSLERGRISLNDARAGYDPARDADVVLRLFQTVAESGATLTFQTESRLEDALPVLASQLEEGAALWQRLRLVLLGTHAGRALRLMHAMGLLELLLPEFHGIDALVIRDAYHRYTVDEHTFVVIDTLHSFAGTADGAAGEWKPRFASIARDLQHPDLLYLAALLHDTGKGRFTDEHTQESARLASSVLRRLELDEYQSRLVLTLIANHLEMSAALRRDIFDAETVRTFAGKVQAPEELRMLALFTFADIQAVHPNALTPWKAENLWRLYIATSNYLDRNIDEERVDSRVSSELVLRVTQALPGESRDVLQFLEGFPQRYLQTRSPEQIRTHYEMSKRLSADTVQLHFAWHADRREIALVTPDRQLLFARVAGVLAAWGMNIITADAFSNAAGIVVDTFRFTDSFRTLEKNVSERARLVQSVHDAIADPDLAAQMITSRKRSRRRAPLTDVPTSVHFDTESSTHATLLQVVSQDLPGLLYAISTTLGEARCSIKVAVIDTEGETAIDVFYVTCDDEPLDREGLPALREKILAAIGENAG